MQLITIRQPLTTTFSGDPIHFHLQLAPFNAAANSGYGLNVAVEVDNRYRSNNYITAYTETYFFDELGNVKFDVRSIIDAYLKNYIPAPGFEGITLAEGQYLNWRLRLSVSDGTNLVIAPTTSSVFVSYKGGQQYDRYLERFFENSNNLSYFLGNDQQLQRIRYNQPVWLHYRLQKSDTLSYIQLRCRLFVTASNGSTYNTEIFDWASLNTPNNNLYLLTFTPAEALLRQALPAGTDPVSFEVRLERRTGPFASYSTMARAFYHIDTRPFYNTYTLLYATGMTFRTLVLRGQIEFETDYTRQQALSVPLGNYFKNLSPLPQTQSFTPRETERIKADTGFITLAELQQLRALLLSHEVYVYEEGKLLPVTLNNGNTKLYTNNNQLFSLQLELAKAWQNEYHQASYPLSSDIASCPAMRSAAVSQYSNTQLLVSWSCYDNYDEVELTYVVDLLFTETITLRGNSGTQIITIPEEGLVDRDNDGDLSITANFRTRCGVNNWGPITQVNTFIGQSTNPVALPDTFFVPGGLIQPITLQPSVLANDFDPDGDAIECAPVTNQPTSQGGTISISTDGFVTYQAPTQNFAGADEYTYTLRKVLNTASTATAGITLLVQVSGTGVFARITLRNLTTSGGDITTVFGEVWVEYFSNPQGTLPQDTTGQALTINIRRTRTDRSDSTNNDSTVTATGTQQQIFRGILSQDFADNITGRGRSYSITYTLLPGTGYTVI